MPKKVVIVGSGPAGIAAARAAAEAGADVTLIGDQLGGRAGWHSLVPSKVWLAAADSYGLAQNAALLGITTREVQVVPTTILTRIENVSQTWAAQQIADLESLGVELVTAAARLEGPDRVAIFDPVDGGASQISADALILTTGSVPVFPEGLKPDGQRVLAPRFVRQLDRLPRSVVVIGAGPTSTEFVYLFNRMGVETTWIIDPFGVLPGFPPETGEFLAELLARRGVRLVRDHLAERIEREDAKIIVHTDDSAWYDAEMAFVGIGRMADFSRLNLQAAGLAAEPASGLRVNGFGQTRVPRIYAAGDVIGAPMLANDATALASVAGRHAAGMNVEPFDPRLVIHAVYSEPQVAQVGELVSQDTIVEYVQLPYTAMLKTHLLPEQEGYLRLAFEPQTGRLRGAVAVGAHAADLLAPLAVALRLKAHVLDLAELAPAHPTTGELLFLAAQEARRKLTSPA